MVEILAKKAQTCAMALMGLRAGEAIHSRQAYEAVSKHRPLDQH